MDLSGRVDREVGGKLEIAVDGGGMSPFKQGCA